MARWSTAPLVCSTAGSRRGGAKLEVGYQNLFHATMDSRGSFRLSLRLFWSNIRVFDDLGPAG
jgi:hypothetical protein